VDDDGAWVGAVDWEFAYPDVRAADVSRYPSWEWVHRPDLVEAFDEGYGAILTPVDPTQRHVARTLYALTAVVWGRETSYAGFERGRPLAAPTTMGVSAEVSLEEQVQGIDELAGLVELLALLARRLATHPRPAMLGLDLAPVWAVVMVVVDLTMLWRILRRVCVVGRDLGHDRLPPVRGEASGQPHRTRH